MVEYYTVSTYHDILSNLWYAPKQRIQNRKPNQDITSSVNQTLTSTAKRALRSESFFMHIFSFIEWAAQINHNFHWYICIYFPLYNGWLNQSQLPLRTYLCNERIPCLADLLFLFIFIFLFFFNRRKESCIKKIIYIETS